MGAYGATCDNMLSVDVVTAEGRLLTASASENEDLFWALRGGGGNFAIATSLEYRMHRVGPPVIAGAVLYPFEQTRKVLARFRDFAETAPDPLTVYPCLIRWKTGCRCSAWLPAMPDRPKTANGRSRHYATWESHWPTS
jgi:FAD/FMN-containing dehydrogenase